MRTKRIDYNTIDFIMSSNDRLQIRELHYAIQDLKNKDYNNRYFRYFMERYYFKKFMSIFVDLENPDSFKYYLR